MKNNNVQTKEAQQEIINKPIGLLKKEFIEKIVKDINDSELPLLVVSYILRDILRDVNNTMNQQDNAELSQYQAQLKSLEEKQTN